MTNAEQDRYAWLIESAERLRRGELGGLDLDQIAEELEDMGRSERHALAGHLKILMLHLLKWRYQPDLRGPSWRRSIIDARDEIMELLADSPSLRRQLPELIARRYPAARRLAILETGLGQERFPEVCPFTPEELLDPEFWPEARP